MTCGARSTSAAEDLAHALVPEADPEDGDAGARKVRIASLDTPASSGPPGGPDRAR